jgi:hypothetical protein
MSLVLNILRGLSPRYGHLKAILKRQKPFPTFEQVRSDLLLEELESTADTATATTLYSATWTAPSDSGGGGGAPHPPSPPSPASGVPRQASSSGGGGGSRGRKGGGKGVRGGGRAPAGRGGA